MSLRQPVDEPRVFFMFNIQWRLPTAFQLVVGTPWDLIMKVATDIAPQSVKLNTETHNPAARRL